MTTVWTLNHHHNDKTLFSKYLIRYDGDVCCTILHGVSFADKDYLLTLLARRRA
jgi:hypothetical protein